VTSTTLFSQRRGCKPIFVQPSKARPDGAAWDDAIFDNVRTHLICDKDLFEMTDDARRHQHLLRLGHSQTSCLVCEFMDVLGDFSASQFGLPARQVLLFFSSHSRGQKCEKKLAKLVPRMHRDGVHATRKLSQVDGSGYGSFIRGTQFWCGKANNPQYLQISPEMRDIKPPSSWEVCDIGLTFQVDKKTALEKTCFLSVYR